MLTNSLKNVKIVKFEKKVSLLNYVSVLRIEFYTFYAMLQCPKNLPKQIAI